MKKVFVYLKLCEQSIFGNFFQKWAKIQLFYLRGKREFVSQNIKRLKVYRKKPCVEQKESKVYESFGKQETSVKTI